MLLIINYFFMALVYSVIHYFSMHTCLIIYLIKKINNLLKCITIMHLKIKIKTLETYCSCFIHLYNCLYGSTGIQLHHLLYISSLSGKEQMLIFGGFDGVMLNDIMVYTPGTYRLKAWTAVWWSCDIMSDRWTCFMLYDLITFYLD